MNYTEKHDAIISATIHNDGKVAQLKTLLAEIEKAMAEQAKVRDSAYADFHSMANDDMVAKAAQKETARDLGLEYVSTWRARGTVKKSLASYRNLTQRMPVSSLFEDLYCDANGRCYSDADSGL